MLWQSKHWSASTNLSQEWSHQQEALVGHPVYKQHNQQGNVLWFMFVWTWLTLELGCPVNTSCRWLKPEINNSHFKILLLQRVSAKWCQIEVLDTWFWGLYHYFSVCSGCDHLRCKCALQQTHSSTQPIPLHYFAVYGFGLGGADSYFRFHHFLFIIHGFHSDENNHISIQAFFSDFECADKHYFVLCQAFGVSYKGQHGRFQRMNCWSSPAPTLWYKSFRSFVI